MSWTANTKRILMTLAVASLFGCSGGADTNTDGLTGCQKDTDCKGERICDIATNTCVEPMVMMDGCAVDNDCKGDRICDPATKKCVDPAPPPGMDASVEPPSDAGVNEDATTMGNPDAMTSTTGRDAGTMMPPDAGMLPKGQCCNENITPGCLDTAVESCVCAQRPSCCTNVWDAECVRLVRAEQCGTCPGTCGDGFCDPASEDLQNCCEDCGADPSDPTGMTPQLGDGRCCAALGEDPCSSPADCGEMGDPNGPRVESFCGDGICCPATGEAVCDGTSGCRDCQADPADPANDGFCCLASGENACNAPGSNCPASVAGDGICGCDETCRTSPFDCGTCGDCCTITGNVPGCSDASIEACVCALDSACCNGQWDNYCVSLVRSGGCGACITCGDRICDAPPNPMAPATDRNGGNYGEDSVNCCEDCTRMGTVFGTGQPGDGACNCGENACSTDGLVVTDCGPPQVGSSCGNGGCESCAPWNEATTNCPADCGTSCGDGVCNGNETRCGCPQDCPQPGQMVATGIQDGDGICECTENCATAPLDCGLCPACLVMGAPQPSRVPPIDATGFVNAGAQAFTLFAGLPDEQEPSCMPAGSVSSHELVFVINNNAAMSRSLTVETIVTGMTDTVVDIRTDCNDASSAVACNADTAHTNKGSRVTFSQGTQPLYIVVDTKGAGSLGSFDLVITLN